MREAECRTGRRENWTVGKRKNKLRQRRRRRRCCLAVEICERVRADQGVVEVIAGAEGVK